MAQAETPEQARGIFQRLYAAQRRIEKVSKSSYNQYADFWYTSAETMVAECREALHAEGLLAFRQSWRVDHETLSVVSELVVACDDTGESMTNTVAMPYVSGKGRPTDKAVATALTASLNYWLRDLLLVPRVSLDEEMSARRDEHDEEPITQEQAAELAALFDQIGDDTLLPRLLQWQGIEKLTDMPASRFRVVQQRLKKRLEQGQ